jgi:TonB family protein
LIERYMLAFRSRAVRRLFALALMLSAAGLARAEEHWIVARTAHFEMYSTASEKESKRTLVSLEQFRANFLSLLPLRNGAEPRTTVVLFDADRQFRPFKPIYQGKPRDDIAGYCLAGDDETVIALTSDLPDLSEDPAKVIYHEYVHLLLRARDEHLPLWLNEGLAELFSTFRVENGKVEYGVPIESHVGYLRHTGLMSLDRLVAVTPESPDYNESDRAGIFYAESWAFTHFLLCGEDRNNAKRLEQFMQLVAQDVGLERSFRVAFGADYRTEEDALRHYLDGGKYFTRQAPSVMPDVPISFRPATAFERDFALLNLRWRAHGDADVASRALALLQQDPKQPGPHELLAEIAATEGDSAGAHEHWQSAAELNSDNPWIYVHLLREQLSPYDGRMLLDVRLSPDRIAPMRALAQRALTLSPDNADAIELAVIVESLAEKMDVRVINRLQGRVAGIRNPGRAFLALGIVHWRLKDDAGARKLVRLAELDRRASSPTLEAASALSAKLPTDPAEQSGAPTDMLAAVAQSKGIGLQMAHAGAAADYLDDLLATRGTTAALVAVDPVVVRPLGRTQPDPWHRADELRQKAQAGDANAMFDLAVAHACGNGVEFSTALAKQWLQKAVEHGYAFNAAGVSPEKLDPELLAQYLRGQADATASATLPPLEPELKRRIAEAAASAPSQPFTLVYHPAPRFPDDAQRLGKAGDVRVRFRVRDDGHTDNVQATQFSDSALASAAEQCVRDWRFIPTIRDQAPVATYAEVRFTFQPDKSAATSK